MEDKQTLFSSDCLMAYLRRQDYDTQKLKVGLQYPDSTLRTDCQLSPLGMRATSLDLSRNLEKSFSNMVLNWFLADYGDKLLSARVRHSG